MSNKMPLPDKLLDAVSGGLLTYGGEIVTDFSVSEDSMSITTQAGTFTRQLTAKDKAELKEEGGAAEMSRMLTFLDQNEKVFALEDMGFPAPSKL